MRSLVPLQRLSEVSAVTTTVLVQLAWKWNRHLCSSLMLSDHSPSFSLKHKLALNPISSFISPTDSHYCSMWFPPIFLSFSLIFFQEFTFQLRISLSHIVLCIFLWVQDLCCFPFWHLSLSVPWILFYNDLVICPSTITNTMVTPSSLLVTITAMSLLSPFYDFHSLTANFCHSISFLILHWRQNT